MRKQRFTLHEDGKPQKGNTARIVRDITLVYGKTGQYSVKARLLANKRVGFTVVPLEDKPSREHYRSLRKGHPIMCITGHMDKEANKKIYDVVVTTLRKSGKAYNIDDLLVKIDQNTSPIDKLLSACGMHKETDLSKVCRF